MRKIIVIGMVLMLVFMVFATMPMNVSADPGTIIVPDDYTTIQAAINAANPGDTVYVKAGTYYEHVIINKALTLQGEDRDSTIIDGGGTGDVVYISADWTILEGLTATNAGTSPGRSGVEIDNADHCRIEDVKASDNNDLGINLRYADYCVINHNYVANNYLGILSYWSTNNEFGFNYIYNNPANGLQTATGWQGGIHTESDSWIHDNTVIGNGIGVTWVTAGIFLWGSGSKNNIIENNLCDGNKDGIHFRASGITGNIIRGNIIKNSLGAGITYTGGAGPNKFYHNNFINNANDLAGTRSNDIWDDGYPSGGNYWDTYTGMDNYNGPAQNIPGPDGIGDTSISVTGGGTDNYPLISPWSLNQPPVANANGPYEADEGTEITFDASGSSDPDDDELQYRWDFDDDGTWDTSYSTDPTAAHTWFDDYSGDVTVEVYDGTVTDTATALVTVNNVAPTASIDNVIQPYSEFIMPTDLLEFYGGFTDPSTEDTHTIKWDFDDGTIITDTLTPTHAYAEPGLYTVALTITDDDDGIDTAEIIIEVKSTSEAAEEVVEIVEDIIAGLEDAPPGLEQNLLNPLGTAVEKLEEGNENAGTNKLDAFINQVEAQRGKKLTDEEADALIAAAQWIIDNVEENGT